MQRGPRRARGRLRRRRARAPTTTTATAVTYVGVAGGSVSFGMTQSPTGCNPHTTAGNTPATQLVLDAVLPSPFMVGADGIGRRATRTCIMQAEVVSTKPADDRLHAQPEGGLVRRRADHRQGLHLRLDAAARRPHVGPDHRWPARPGTGTSSR